MPARKSASGGTTRRKHSLGNLRRAHPASGATWNVQVVRGKISSKCLWHACRALVLGLTLMFLGAGMATIGYYADQLSVGSEIRGNATVRVKNESKGFHLNNLSYVGPIVMGFGGFIVVASCVMTFEARDSAAKVVPARLKTTNNNKIALRSNPNSVASQRRATGLQQQQTTRWDHHLGVFRSSPAEVPVQPQPLDRQALTAALVHFSKSISNSSRFSPQVRRLSHAGSVPNLSTSSPHPYANSLSISHLLSPNRKSLYQAYKRHRHHHHHHHHHPSISSSNTNGRQIRPRATRVSSSLVARSTRESALSLLVQPIPLKHRLYCHATSIDESGRVTTDNHCTRLGERTKRSDTAKRHVFTRQKPIEQEEEQHRIANNVASPLGKRRSSTLSDSSYSGRWTYRCASIASRASSIDSRKIQVDLHSPDVPPKSILRSPKRLNSSGASTTPSVDKDFRSQLSVCSEPPVPVRQLSGQSSIGLCLHEESPEIEESPNVVAIMANTTSNYLPLLQQSPVITSAKGADRIPPGDCLVESPSMEVIGKKPRPATLPLNINLELNLGNNVKHKSLQRSNSSHTFDRPKTKYSLESVDVSTFAMKSHDEASAVKSIDDNYDSLRVISERRHKLLKSESETALIQLRPNYGCTNIEDASGSGKATAIELDDIQNIIKSSELKVENPDAHQNDESSERTGSMV